MDCLHLDPDLLHGCLRAIKAVALADGHFDDTERRLVRAVARALHLDVDVDALAPLYPEDLPERLPEPAWRERIVQA